MMIESWGKSFMQLWKPQMFSIQQLFIIKHDIPASIESNLVPKSFK